MYQREQEQALCQMFNLFMYYVLMYIYMNKFFLKQKHCELLSLDLCNIICLSLQIIIEYMPQTCYTGCITSLPSPSQASPKSTPATCSPAMVPPVIQVLTQVKIYLLYTFTQTGNQIQGGSGFSHVFIIFDFFLRWNCLDVRMGFTLSIVVY